MLNNDQIWTLVFGILLGISEILGSVKRGPNGILHAVWKFYNLKVELEYDEDGNEIDEGEGVNGVDEERRVNETFLPDRETIVLGGINADNGVIGPNVLLIK
ncbi:MAG: hypothetical protein RLZZ86_109 [Cyanobacteriota bacterium]|jgi:hypothetical protein